MQQGIIILWDYFFYFTYIIKEIKNLQKSSESFYEFRNMLTFIMKCRGT